MAPRADEVAVPVWNGQDREARKPGAAIFRRQPLGAGMLGGSLALTFFVYVMVNGGMISGLLPVVGVPMPLISYGGTSAVTLLAGFGLLQSIHAHRRLVAT